LKTILLSHEGWQDGLYPSPQHSFPQLTFMPSTESLAAFTLAALLMNLSPGPANLYVVARTLSQGLRGGFTAAAGLALGGLVHVLATVFGLSALLAYSPTAYSLLKTVGAMYLIYLGIGYFMASKTPQEGAFGAKVKSLKTVFFESALVEITNPKTALFFLALLPQFVDVSAGPVAPQLLLLGLIVTLSAVPCDLLVTVFANRFSVWIKTNRRAQSIQNLLSGTVLTGLGLYVLARKD